MSPDTRRLAIWSGSGAAVLLAGFVILLVRDGTKSTVVESADSLHATYTKLYHPDKPEGFAVDEAQQELTRITAEQTAELRAVEGSLAPAIPSAYLVDQLSEAAAQVTADYSAMRQLSTRSKIPIPAGLPFEGGLDADAKARSRQLASLALIRQAVQTCINAGVARVAAVNPGQATASPGGEYAVFTCDLDIEADWAATARLLAAFAQTDGRGLGLRALEVTGGADKPLRAKLTATLTTLNNEAWALAAAPAPAAAPAAGASAPAEGGSRLRRLGGARP